MHYLGPVTPEPFEVKIRQVERQPVCKPVYAYARGRSHTHAHTHTHTYTHTHTHW